MLLLLVSIVQSVQLVNALNSTMSGGTSGNTTITTAGNKTVITTGTAVAPTTSPPNYNRTGFNNLYVLTINGKNFPIKYSINGGKLVSKQCECKNIIY
ncbi:MAG: hypothetical protein FIO04_07300 [Nitrosopumilales archaeon]|nr:hypothetical protein [Nitrosopumilales archaeon]